MKFIYVLIGVVFLFVNCSDQKPNNSLKFSPEEISSLNLSSTQMIKRGDDLIEKFDLSSYLGERSFSLGNMIKSIRYLPLETTKESLIAEISQIIVSDKNIYISDNQLNSVLIFDENGKYLNQIRKGQGPGEILQLKGIAYDTIDNELIVYHNKFLSFFSQYGEFKKRENIPLNARYFTLIPKGYLFYTLNGVDNSHLGYSENNQILITDKSFTLKTRGFPYRLFKNVNYGGEGIHVNNEEINLTFSFIDTIYQFVNIDTVKAKYAFNLGKKKIPDNVLLNISSMDEFVSTFTENDYYYFSGRYDEIDDYIFIAFRNQFAKAISNFFINKITTNIEGGTQLLQDERFPYLSYPIASKGSFFVSFAQPYDIIPNLNILNNEFVSKENMMSLRKLRDDDNPVLIFYELQ